MQFFSTKDSQRKYLFTNSDILHCNLVQHQSSKNHVSAVHWK